MTLPLQTFFLLYNLASCPCLPSTSFPALICVAQVSGIPLQESRSLRERLKAAETRRGPSPVSPMFAFEQFVVESLTRKQRRPQFDLAATVEAIRKEGSSARGGAATRDRAQAAPGQGFERFRGDCEAVDKASGQGFGFSGERNEQNSGEGNGGSQALHREGFKGQGGGGNVNGLEGLRDGGMEERSGGLAELKLEATLGSGVLRSRDSSGCCGLPKSRSLGVSAGSDGERKGSAGQNVRREHAMQHNPLYEQSTLVSSCKDGARKAKEAHDRITSEEGAGSSSQQKPREEVDAISRDGNTVQFGGVDGRNMGELTRLDLTPSRNARGEIKWSKTEEELQQALLHLQENLAASEQCQRSSRNEDNGSAFRDDHREGAQFQPTGFGKPDRQSPGAVHHPLDGG
jgi:hypothetical protein